MTARLVETALILALAAAIVMVGAVAAGWIDAGRAAILIVAVAAAGAALSGIQHLTGFTVLAPVEPPEEARQ